MFSAAIVLTYALQTNAPLYFAEAGPPYRDSGARLELEKSWDSGIFAQLNPYAWNAKQDRLGSVGAVFRLGWRGETFSVNFLHESQNNMNREAAGTGGFKHLEFDAVEVTWKIQ